MKRFILIAFLVCSSFCLWGQQQINKSVLGFRIGATYTAQDVRSLMIKLNPGFDDYMNLIIDKESSWTEFFSNRLSVAFAGKKWYPTIVITADNKLAKISLSSRYIDDEGFKELLAMYTQKYGEPNESTGQYFRWGDDVSISLEKDTNRVALIYYSETLCKQIEMDVYNEI